MANNNDSEKSPNKVSINKLHNFYKCPRCKNTWDFLWDSICNDECLECHKKNIPPYKREEPM